MNSTVALIFTVAGALLLLLSAYGAVTRNRKAFISGFCFYSLLPVIGESMAYRSDKAPVHLLMVFLFLVQLVLEIPDNNMYGRDNTAATSLATKMGLALLVINVGAALYVFGLNSGVPVQFGYYHIGFIICVLFVMARRFTSSTVAWAK